MFYYLKQIFHDSSIDLQGSLCTGALGISVFFLRYFSNISNLLKTGKNLLSSLFLTFQPKAVITDHGPPPGGVWGKINSNFTRPWGQGCGTILPSTLDHSLSYPHSQAGEAEIMGFVQALSADSGSYIYIWVYMGLYTPSVCLQGNAKTKPCWVSLVDLQSVLGIFIGTFPKVRTHSSQPVNTAILQHSRN